MQYKVTQSSKTSNVLIKELFSLKKTKQGLTQFLERQVVNHLNSEDTSFVAATSGKIHIKKDAASNNQDTSNKFLRHFLGTVYLENDVVCVKSNNTYVLNIILANYEKLNCLTLLIAWSNEKWITLNKV